MRGAFYAKRSGETDSCARFEARTHTERLFKPRTLPLTAASASTYTDFATNGYSRNDVTGALFNTGTRADAKTIDPPRSPARRGKPDSKQVCAVK